MLRLMPSSVVITNRVSRTSDVHKASASSVPGDEVSGDGVDGASGESCPCSLSDSACSDGPIDITDTESSLSDDISGSPSDSVSSDMRSFDSWI